MRESTARAGMHGVLAPGPLDKTAHEREAAHEKTAASGWPGLCPHTRLLELLQDRPSTVPRQPSPFNEALVKLTRRRRFARCTFALRLDRTDRGSRVERAGLTL